MEAKREAGITKGLMTKAIEAAAYEAEESMLRRYKQNDTNATSSPLVWHDACRDPPPLLQSQQLLNLLLWRFHQFLCLWLLLFQVWHALHWLVHPRPPPTEMWAVLHLHLWSHSLPSILHQQLPPYLSCPEVSHLFTKTPSHLLVFTLSRTLAHAAFKTKVTGLTWHLN